MHDLPRMTEPSARGADPWTSHVAAASVRGAAVTQRQMLLETYEANPAGLTDEEACALAAIPGGWKRCSELRALGLIRDTGLTRAGTSGRMGRVCAATTGGIAASLFPEPKGGFRR